MVHSHLDITAPALQYCIVCTDKLAANEFSTGVVRSVPVTRSATSVLTIIA